MESATSGDGPAISFEAVAALGITEVRTSAFGKDGSVGQLAILFRGGGEAAAQAARDRLFGTDELVQCPICRSLGQTVTLPQSALEWHRYSDHRDLLEEGLRLAVASRLRGQEERRRANAGLPRLPPPEEP